MIAKEGVLQANNFCDAFFYSEAGIAAIIGAIQLKK